MANLAKFRFDEIKNFIFIGLARDENKNLFLTIFDIDQDFLTLKNFVILAPCSKSLSSTAWNLK